MGIIRYPNQKIIHIHADKCNGNDSSKPYGCISRESAKTAARILLGSTAAYILYIHFALNRDGYEFALSPKAIEAELGLSEEQYRSAVYKLIDTGYLVKDKYRKNRYEFYTMPQVAKETTIATDKGMDKDISKNEIYTEKIYDETEDDWNLDDIDDETLGTNNYVPDKVAEEEFRIWYIEEQENFFRSRINNPNEEDEDLWLDIMEEFECEF